MGKRDDDRLTEVLRAARRGPREGWRERALSAMAAAGREREKRGLRWAPTAAGAVLVAAALAFAPYSATGPSGVTGGALAAQQAAAAEALGAGERAGSVEGQEARREELPEHLRRYGGRAAEFVRERYPGDPEMLMAAGLLTRDVKEGMSLLKEAAERSSEGAAWAAYADALLEAVPAYSRPANWGVDPADAEAVEEFRRRDAEAGVPDRLSPEGVAPAMEVLRQWEAVEPGNGLPVALEVSCLYGLHRDSDALLRWEEASRRPESSTHAQQRLWAVERLLSEMGMPSWDAMYAAYAVGSELVFTARLRDTGRIGLYEGRLARLEGRDEEAVRWWEATVGVGRGMQESGGTLMEHLLGVAIEGIGASDVWQWDRPSGAADGPLEGGRLFLGGAHEFYAARAGGTAADGLRDSLVRAKVRAMLIKDHIRGMPAVPEGLMRPVLLRGMSMVSVSLVVVFLVIFGAVSVWARRQADEATRLGWRWSSAAAVLCLLPALAAAGVLWVGGKGGAEFQPALHAVVLGGLALLSLVGMIVVPLIVARWSREPGARLVAAWRGNLRRVLPAAVVLCAVLSLGVGLAARRADAEWVEQWHAETEMERVAREIGPEWAEPKIPEDAWRAELSPRMREG